MGKYCDNKELEKIWARWEFASATPDLEILRDSELLFTRIVDIGSEHFINSIQPFHFCLKMGSLAATATIVSAFRSSLLPSDAVPPAHAPKEYPSLSVPVCRDSGEYYFERPIDIYWGQLVDMIYSICNGLSLKFHPKSPDERSELVHEALLQILSKIERKKLSFTPGKAPAFNLLTTAIYRVMCSIKNKSKRYRDNRSGLAEDVYNKKTLPNFRSIKVTESSAFTSYGDQ